MGKHTYTNAKTVRQEVVDPNSRMVVRRYAVAELRNIPEVAAITRQQIPNHEKHILLHVMRMPHRWIALLTGTTVKNVSRDVWAYTSGRRKWHGPGTPIKIIIEVIEVEPFTFTEDAFKYKQPKHRIITNQT